MTTYASDQFEFTLSGVCCPGLIKSLKVELVDAIGQPLRKRETSTFANRSFEATFTFDLKAAQDLIDALPRSALPLPLDIIEAPVEFGARPKPERETFSGGVNLNAVERNRERDLAWRRENLTFSMLDRKRGKLFVPWPAMPLVAEELGKAAESLVELEVVKDA